uniref:Uncharacterized protein n=1 Tax=Romanomermis culicivorax TaxID=13658 RepID=A0A915KDB7_ROMCU
MNSIFGPYAKPSSQKSQTATIIGFVFIKLIELMNKSTMSVIPCHLTSRKYGLENNLSKYQKIKRTRMYKDTNDDE